MRRACSTFGHGGSAATKDLPIRRVSRHRHQVPPHHSPVVIGELLLILFFSVLAALATVCLIEHCKYPSASSLQTRVWLWAPTRDHLSLAHEDDLESILIHYV